MIVVDFFKYWCHIVTSITQYGERFLLSPRMIECSLILSSQGDALL